MAGHLEYWAQIERATGAIPATRKHIDPTAADVLDVAALSEPDIAFCEKPMDSAHPTDADDSAFAEYPRTHGGLDVDETGRVVTASSKPQT